MFLVTINHWAEVWKDFIIRTQNDSIAMGNPTLLSSHDAFDFVPLGLVKPLCFYRLDDSFRTDASRFTGVCQLCVQILRLRVISKYLSVCYWTVIHRDSTVITHLRFRRVRC
jgi:hypothetical protein